MASGTFVPGYVPSNDKIVITNNNGPSQIIQKNEVKPTSAANIK